jgi:hypothetical protein
MPSALAPIVAFYDYALKPVSALAWIGGPVPILDVAAAFRLALILRQDRELFRNKHLAALKQAKNGQTGQNVDPLEQRSCVRDFATTFLMVFGGEAVVGASKLSHPPIPIEIKSATLSALARRAALFCRLRRLPSPLHRHRLTRRFTAYRPRSVIIYGVAIGDS